MTPRSLLLTVALALPACATVAKRDLELEIRLLSAQVDEARRLQGSACSPVSFARAETQLAFAKVEFDEADVRRAGEHIDAAKSAAEVALTASRACLQEDADKDGVPDAADQCPTEAEDKDGDRDDDGCPDVSATGDVDGDGIDNADDQCLTVPEDLDGHEDEDGCPEDSPDRDGDGIVDAIDACPDEPEDLDRFEDGDGCPDPDDDGDGVPDAVDACPSAPEDLDFFDDEDGCPEADNDRDGVADAEDACPTLRGMIALNGCPADDKDQDGVRDAEDACPDDKETRNGVMDDDGCPDAVASTASVDGARIVLDAPLPFRGDTLHETAKPALAAVAEQFLARGGTLRVRSHVDATRDKGADQVRAETRGMALRSALIDAGVPGEQLVIEAVGGAEPIDTNRTASGRAANRRVEFLIE